MKTLTRSFVLMALALGFASGAIAQFQEVTVREINEVPQANIDALIALGGSATQQDVDDNVIYNMEGALVEFTAVVLSDPYNSGLASWNSDANQPNRTHVFVRDTAAVGPQGVGGMTTQLVDASGAVIDLEVGFVYIFQGEVSSFGGTIQVNPEAFEELGTYQELDLPDEIMDPVPVTTDDLNSVVSTAFGETVVQINWANYNDMNSQYVRFEDQLVTANAVNGDRYNWQWTSSGTDAVVNSDDISIRYRNDRGGDGDYPNPPWNSHAGEDFEPPAIGAAIDVQGYALYRGFDFNGNSTPDGVLMVVSPWEDEDLEVNASPPIFGSVQGIDDVIGNEAVEISVEVTPDPSRNITSVELDYYDAGAGRGFGGTVVMSDDGGGVYSGTIPAAPDETYVGFTITANDNEGGESTTEEVVYLVLYDGISSIAQIQTTHDGQPGDSPFNGITTSNIDVTATVQADFFGGGTRYLILQDDASLDPWTGIWAIVDDADPVTEGDEINITESEIVDIFDVTFLDMPTFTVESSGSPFPHKNLVTGLLNGDDPGFQEAHEGMLLRFENVSITDVNADGDDGEPGFGEWQFSSDGTEANELRADDLSDAFPSDYNVLNFEVGQGREFIQGAFYYSFGAYKLIPVVSGDIGGIIVSNEPVGPAAPGTYVLHDAYPNPFNPTATIKYEIGAAGPVTLKVYDALGREVATLVDGTLSPSVYEATFDASNLASGVYVYRLVAGSEVLTGSMTLLK